MYQPPMPRTSFDLLLPIDRLGLLYRDGVQLGKRTEAGSAVLLYELYGFYVEIFYRDSHLDPERIRSFTCQALLEPYIRKILEEYFE